jgi:uncharacterized membrane protein
MFERTTIAAALAFFIAGGPEPTFAEGPLDLHAVATSPASTSAPPARHAPTAASSRNPNVEAGSNGVNGSTTATYLAETYRGGDYQGAGVARFWSFGTTFGCMALSPIIVGVLVDAKEHRELTSREVHVMMADCTIPLVGGWLMGKYFDSIEVKPAAPDTAQQANTAAAAQGVKR